MFRILPQITHQTPFNSDYFSIYYMLYINRCLSKKAHIIAIISFFIYFFYFMRLHSLLNITANDFTHNRQKKNVEFAIKDLSDFYRYIPMISKQIVIRTSIIATMNLYLFIWKNYIEKLIVTYIANLTTNYTSYVNWFQYDT